MSIIAKLYVDEKSFTILNFRYSIEQNSDYNGYPSAKPTGGLWSIVIESTKEHLFYEWMVAENTMKNIEIVLSNASMNGKTRTIKLFDVYCLKYMENFDGVNSKPMSTYLEVSPAIMQDGGTKIFEKYWKVSDLSNMVAPTVVNDDEEEPNFISHHFEDEQGVIIEQEEIEVGDEINLIIESINGNGRSVTINLDDDLLDYEYNGKRLENDILKNITVTGDVTTVKLKAIKQKK